MADYKDMIMGTLKTIADKVKDVADSSSVRDVYEQGAGRAKTYGSIAKLSLEINGESEELKRVFAEIGKLCYEQSKDAPEGFFAPLFAQADELLARIDEKQGYINALRADLEAQRSSGFESSIRVDIESEPETEPEVAETVEEAFEVVVENTEKDGSGQE